MSGRKWYSVRLWWLVMAILNFLAAALGEGWPSAVSFGLGVFMLIPDEMYPERMRQRTDA